MASNTNSNEPPSPLVSPTGTVGRSSIDRGKPSRGSITHDKSDTPVKSQPLGSPLNITTNKTSVRSPTSAGATTASSPSPSPSPSSPTLTRRPSGTAAPPLPTATHRLSNATEPAKPATTTTTTPASPHLTVSVPQTPASPLIVTESSTPAPSPPAEAQPKVEATPTPAPAPAPKPIVEVTEIAEEIDPGKTPEERLKRYKTRQKVASEILSTEATYVAALNTLQNVYIKNLLDEKNGMLTQEQSETLFSNIPVLQPFQQQFMESLKEILDKWSPTSQEIGGLFLKFAPFFKMYTQYVNNYDYAASLLQKLEKSDAFCSFVRRLREQHPTLMDLQSYQITPIQRVPRYKLLIAELLRFTNPKHPDFALLTKAMDVMSDVAMHINEAVRKQQISQQLLNLQEKFSGAIQLIGPNSNGIPGGRRLIKQGPLSKKGRRSDQVYEFFLFTDFLIYARPVGFGGQFKLHRKIFVNSEFAVTDMKDGSDTLANERHCIQVLSAQKSFIVYAKDAAEKSEWMTVLTAAVAEFRKTQEIATPTPSAANSLLPPTANAARRPSSAGIGAAGASNEFGSQQPVFAQFKSNSVCIVCSTRCTFASGRHHCRNCGQICCNNCAKDRIYLSWTKQCSRTCDRCSQKMKDERSAKLEKVVKLAALSNPTPTATPSATTTGGGPPVPSRPSRPHQDQLFRLLNELLETAPRIEETNRAPGTEKSSKTRNMSVLVRPTPVPTTASATNSPAVKPLASPSSAPVDLRALEVVKYHEPTNEKPKVVGKLNFVQTRQSAKTRSHSMMVTNAMNPLSPRSGEGVWENDGLSDSDDENGLEPSTPLSTASTASTPTSKSNVSPLQPSLMERSESGSSTTSSLRSRLSFNEAAEGNEKSCSEETPGRGRSNSGMSTITEESGVTSKPPTIAQPPLPPRRHVLNPIKTTPVAPTVAPPSSPSPVTPIVRASSLGSPSPSSPAPPPLPAIRYWSMARVLFNWAGTDATQLTIHAGDILLVTDKSHDSWWKGETWEPSTSSTPPKKGLFPSAFIFELKDKNEIFEAQGDCTADSDGHLSFATGDLLLVKQKNANGWWSMQHAISRQVGWVPSNFIQLYTKFPQLTKEQEDKLTHILARSRLPAAPAPPSPMVTSPSPTSASSSSSALSPTPPPPARPRLSVGPSTGTGGAVSALQQKLGQTNMFVSGGGSSNGQTSSPQPPLPPGRPSSKSVIVQSTDLLSPSSPSLTSSPNPSHRLPPPVPSRIGRSQSVMQPPPPPAPIAPERQEKRKSIMDSLVSFFTIRPSKETLIAKKIIQPTT